MKAATLFLAIAGAMAQGPPSSAASGETSSTACGAGKISGNCDATGASNYVQTSLAVSGGVFSGWMVTSKCPAWATAKNAGATCVNQTIPAPAYQAVSTSSQAMAAPLLGTTGYSIKYGLVIFGPLEAGFTAGQACSNNKGVCPGGMDLHVCEQILNYQCGTANVITSMLPDKCGAHANPYHYHMGLDCEYNSTDAGHSKLIGVMLDGRGLYGKYESTNTKPANLDACNGHYGPTPTTTINGVTYPGELNVYHYHVTDAAPYTVSCYGPVSNLAQAKALYTGCSAASTYSGCTAAGQVTNMPYFCPPHVTTFNASDPTCKASANSAASAGPAALLLAAVLAAFVATRSQ